MAQLVLGIAGAVVGSFFGAPQIGFAIGSAIGGYIDAPNVEGPKLSDLNVAVSSYGAAVPQTYGGIRVACTPIWAVPLNEVTTTQSAKGGPEATTHSYFANFAVLVGEGEVAGIRKMWFDAKLVYDISEGVDVETQLANAELEALFTFYPGDETQLPDPTLESYEGVGQVEAYRGTSYIVFKDLPVASNGNRIPIVRVETAAAPSQQETEQLAPLEIGPWSIAGGVPAHTLERAGFRVYLDNGGTLYSDHDSISAAMSAFEAAWPAHGEYLGFWTTVNPYMSIFEAVSGQHGHGSSINNGNGAQYVYLCFNVETPDFIEDIGLSVDGPPGPTFCVNLASSGASPGDGYVYMHSSTWLGAYAFAGAGHQPLMRLVDFDAVDPVGYQNANNCTGYPPDGAGHFPRAIVSPHRVIRIERLPSPRYKTCQPGDPTVDGIAELPGRPTVCISRDGTLSANIDYTLQTGNFHLLQEYLPGGATPQRLPMGPALRDDHPDYNNGTFWAAAVAAAGLPPDWGGPFLVNEVMGGDVPASVADTTSAVLGDIVADICASAGLGAGSIDVADLTDTVLGYARPRVMPARSAIEPLRAAHYFDAVESGSKIVFRKRGRAPIAQIGYEDLGATLGSPVAALESDRKQETELPSTVVVAYQSRTAGYETGAQQSRRRAGGSQQVLTIELPMVLTDDHAAQVAEVLTYEPWSARTQRKISVPQHLARVEPTDTLIVDDGEAVYGLRVIDKTETDGVNELVCVDDDIDIYTSTVAGGVITGGNAGSHSPWLAPTLLVPLDLPLLRSADTSTPVGYYVAATGYASNWGGAQVYASTDGGANYAPLRDISQPATMGSALTGLGSFAGGNIVDEINELDVQLLGAGTLASVTRARLLNLEQVAAVGNEVVGFQRAVALGGGRYRLSGLLRGLGGTERVMNGHTPGERFVLLSAVSLVRQPAAPADVGTQTLLKGVTYGSSLTDAYEESLTFGAVSSRPLSPVQLHAAPVTSGQYLVRWRRRTRVGGTWQDVIDVPLGEDTEAYVVQVLDGATPIGSTQVSTAQATVTASAGNTVRVAQLSALVGAGFFSTITLE